MKKIKESVFITVAFAAGGPCKPDLFWFRRAVESAYMHGYKAGVGEAAEMVKNCLEESDV